MLRKASALSIILSYFAFLPYIFMALYSFMISPINGIPVIIAIFVWGGVFYTSIIIAAKNDSHNKYIIDTIQIGVFLLCRISVQSLQLEDLKIMLDLAFTSWLTLLILHKFLSKKAFPSITYIIIACVFPYLYLSLLIPQAILYMNNSGLPVFTEIDFLSFENLIRYLAGPIITVGILSMCHIKQKIFTLMLFIVHIVIMLKCFDILNLFTSWYNEFVLFRFIVYPYFMIGCLFSIIPFIIHRKSLKKTWLE